MRYWLFGLVVSYTVCSALYIGFAITNDALSILALLGPTKISFGYASEFLFGCACLSPLPVVLLSVAIWLNKPAVWTIFYSTACILMLTAALIVFICYGSATEERIISSLNLSWLSQWRDIYVKFDCCGFNGPNDWLLHLEGYPSYCCPQSVNITEFLITDQECIGFLVKGCGSHLLLAIDLIHEYTHYFVVCLICLLFVMLPLIVRIYHHHRYRAIMSAARELLGLQPNPDGPAASGIEMQAARGSLNRTQFSLDIDEPEFVDFQLVRIQEIQEELPRGCIPRNVDIILRGEAVEQIQPGDHCDFTGTLITIPDVSVLSAGGQRADTKSRSKGKDAAGGLQGLKSLGVREPTVLMFDQITTTADNDNLMDSWALLPENDRMLLMEMAEDGQLVSHLRDALFPNIYGNDDVKLGILLMLCGGVQKHAPGTTLRGDINVLLVGDPSCAKSQFLKAVENFSPRAVYTSGKASSAAVVRDEESMDFVIEAGALMLADNGVCCIDEFDKMDLKDQVAIHEAMEQQTISITKAGVKATLNARASILAAANPVGGRYDKSRPLRYNIQLSEPIMSRFDLFFVLTDECNDILDYAIARRIVDNAMDPYAAAPRKPKYSVADVRKYVSFVKHFKPQLSDAAQARLRQEYKKLRLGTGNSMVEMSSRSTVRQLESLIRLSEALARLQCVTEVTEEHVANATKLLTKCFVHLDQPEVELEDDFGDDAEFRVDDDDENTAPDAPARAENGDDAAIVKATGAAPASQGVKIAYDDYVKIREMLVQHIRRDEGRDADDDWKGVKRSDLIDWYLHLVQEDMESVADYDRMKKVTELVIKRLCDVENVLIALDEDVDGEPFLVDNPDFEI